MLYAKVIYTGVADHTSASDRMTTICADRFDFEVDDGQAVMTIRRGDKIETMELTGDVWIMNESGKTISQFAVPFSHLKKDEGGEANTSVALLNPEVLGRKHQ
jgi:hypothetical protein